jgi:hypothetical protein
MCNPENALERVHIFIRWPVTRAYRDFINRNCILRRRHFSQELGIVHVHEGLIEWSRGLNRYLTTSIIMTYKDVQDLECEVTATGSFTSMQFFDLCSHRPAAEDTTSICTSAERPDTYKENGRSMFLPPQTSHKSHFIRRPNATGYPTLPFSPAYTFPSTQAHHRAPLILSASPYAPFFLRPRSKDPKSRAHAVAWAD